MAIPQIEEKQQKFTLTITADNISSTDATFSMDNLRVGNNYKPLDASFIYADGREVKRKLNTGEHRISCQTLTRIAFQIYEKDIIALSPDERESFPVCRYSPKSQTLCGIFTSKESFLEYRPSLEYTVYEYGNDKSFVIYGWGIFTPIIFVQECLKRFGEPGDSFHLIYRKKDPKELKEDLDNEKEEKNEEMKKQLKEYYNPYSPLLLESKNIILRGAPGTGKTFLAREIATDIISNGRHRDCTLLSDDEKKQMEFVQFHPSYDYSDFVEGLRPKVNDDGSMGFQLRDGVFKEFVEIARKNYENSLKTEEMIAKEVSVEAAMDEFFSDIDYGQTTFKTVRGNEFVISNVTEKNIEIVIPQNNISNKVALDIEKMKKMLEAEEEFTKVTDVAQFLNEKRVTQMDSYYFVIYKKIFEKKHNEVKSVKKEELKKYVFIIDEINRGEISKIFGELFFSIDPGYRGRSGEVSTQYSNMHSNTEEKFYVPDNVYIIGTMNDIDRSVDSFDFAMRRRFNFIEIKADDSMQMLDDIMDEDKKNEAIKRMTALNNEIARTEGLNENYQIGASYFLKLNTLDFDRLWTECLRPLLKEYIVGMYDESGIMSKFEKAYGYMSNREETNDESDYN